MFEKLKTFRLPIIHNILAFKLEIEEVQMHWMPKAWKIGISK